MFSVLDTKLKKRVLTEGLNIYLKDNVQAWEMDSDGNYHPRSARRAKSSVPRRLCLRSWRLPRRPRFSRINSKLMRMPLSHATEIELKLRLSPECVARLQHNPLLKSLSVSSPVNRKKSTAFTMTLPILISSVMVLHYGCVAKGRRWIQTIKGGGSAIAGLHKREEWEARVLKAQPDITKIFESSFD